MTKTEFEQLLSSLKEKEISEYYYTPGSIPYYRVNKKLYKDQSLDKIMSSQTEDILDFLLLEHEKDLFHETGSFELAYSLEGIGRFRIRFSRQRSSFAVVIVVKSTKIPDVESLELPENVLRNINKEQGLVIICGDKKSKKLTTIASIIKNISENNSKIITTIEDPIEHLLPHGEGIVNQMEIGIDIHDRILGLKEGVSNNSDIIYLSEMSTKEDIKEIFSALEKGFFVIVGMNVSSVESAINHILYVFAENEQIHMKHLLAEHLITIICEQSFFNTDGTPQSIFEILLNNNAVQSMFIENKLSQLNELFEAFPGSGMISMENAMVKAIIEHKISREEALAVVKNPASLLKKLNGVS